jgi:hypothetical protein
MIKADANAPEAIQQKSSVEYKSRADRLHVLSLAAAFGSLFYLIDLEGLLPQISSQNPWAIQIAWYMAYLSCLFGSVHIWLEMLLPFHAANMAAEAMRDFAAIGEDEVRERAVRKTRRFLMWGLPLFGHIACLIGVFLMSAYYRMSNFH